MIKVCYIITKLELGGAQKVALYTAENLEKDTFEDFLITGSGGILDDEAAKKLKVFKVPSLVREISPIKDLRALLKIRKILKKEKPELVHTHSSKAGILGRIAAKLAGVKTIVHTIHGYGFNETQKWYVKYLYIYIEKFCTLFTDKLIVVAKEDMDKGLRYKIAKENKFTLIRAGIDTHYYKTFNPNPDFRKTLADENTKIITTIGPFKPQKNLQDFIKAAGLVCKSVDNVKFFIVGDGDLRPELEKLIADLNLTDKIILLGWRTDIAEILYASDVFAMTSLWEGLPRTILEAMCCSKPVVANAVDGVKEVIREGKNGFKVNPHNYQYTAEKIIYLLQNPTVVNAMGKSAKHSITKEYDINHMVKQHEDLYRKLLQHYLMVCELIDEKAQKKHKRKKRIVITVCAAALIAAFYTYTPYPVAYFLRGAFHITDYKLPADYANLKKNVIFYRDIDYKSNFPNGNLDIIAPKSDPNGKTIFWVHGGGYVGDDNKKIEHYMVQLANSSFTVISINYAFAPEHAFPVQLKQIEQAYCFIKENAAKYGINTDKMYFGGDSAGAQLVAQFINIQTNPIYADMLNEYLENIKLNAVVDVNTLHGAILFCGPYDLKDLIDPPKGTLALPFKQIGKAYFGTTDENNVYVILSNVTTRLSKHFPPVFITDGNTSSFEYQAKKLEDALKQKGVYVQGVFYPKTDEELKHEYQFEITTKYAQNTYNYLIEFLNRKK
ncbi:glycosyltransferase [Endomicrobium proavitum]|uniref:Putative Phosphatidylinositol N-acetylglucosaminyltransferase n=1 Tax=Endomicrobium proavitum TaxID=1408281 RepID=A0A0G3WIY4_9BACT|nr:glycosyltransferase [Endomicrobium proavitum]AKL97850.1 putative Phosphatidylinositol N-acetylglucosaminyltransferase [Endomicrobium proavitum]